MPQLQSAFTALRQVVDADSDVTVGSLEMCERINLNATNRYMNLADAAGGLDNDREHLVRTNEEIDKYCDQIDDLAARVEVLEAIAKEVDEWSQELEVKVRRIRANT